MTALHPYLNFKGNAEEAFNFYKSVFGGEFPMVMRFKDMPGDGRQPEEYQDKIVHIALPIGQHTMLMASDVVGPMADGFASGNQVNIMISPESAEEAHRIFEALSAGGQIIMPLELQFWGDLYGHFTDKFGVTWMVNYNDKYMQQ